MDIRKPKLFCLGGFDVGHFDVEVEGLAGQRVVQIDHDGFVLDLMNAHGAVV